MNLGKILYDVTGTADSKSNISKTREYTLAKFGRYLFLLFLNRMISLVCQFINFFQCGRVPLSYKLYSLACCVPYVSKQNALYNPLISDFNLKFNKITFMSFIAHILFF